MPTLAPLSHPRVASRCPFSVPTQHQDKLPEMSSGIWWCLIDPTEPPKLALKHCQRRLQGGETPPMGTRTRRLLLKPLRAEFLPLKMCFAHLQPRQPLRPPPPPGEPHRDRGSSALPDSRANIAGAQPQGGEAEGGLEVFHLVLATRGQRCRGMKGLHSRGRAAPRSCSATEVIHDQAEREGAGWFSFAFQSL